MESSLACVLRRVSHARSTSIGNGDASYRIGKAIRDYVTRNLERPALPAVASLPLQVADYAGWYEVDTPRVEMTHFLSFGHHGVDSLQGRQAPFQLSGRVERHIRSGNGHAIPTRSEEERRIAGIGLLGKAGKIDRFRFGQEPRGS